MYNLLMFIPLNGNHSSKTFTSFPSTHLQPPQAPDKSVVRPVAVLKKALELIKSKWISKHNYHHTCEQLKSVRQDLTVRPSVFYSLIFSIIISFSPQPSKYNERQRQTLLLQWHLPHSNLSYPSLLFQSFTVIPLFHHYSISSPSFYSFSILSSFYSFTTVAPLHHPPPPTIRCKARGTNSRCRCMRRTLASPSNRVITRSSTNARPSLRPSTMNTSLATTSSFLPTASSTTSTPRTPQVLDAFF